MIGPQVQALVELGRLPSTEEAIADDTRLDEYETRLQAIQQPVTDDEARALFDLFGPDDCFGLAWTLLHLIESAPHWPVGNVLDGVEGEWPECMRRRARRGAGSSEVNSR